jgi:linoleoyl-CoA desaturase
MVPAICTGELKFAVNDGFQTEVKRRVDKYFQTTGKKPRDCPQMYVKTAIIFAWFWGSYLSLVFLAEAWWQAIAAAVSLGLSMAAVGFNVQHDGGHRAYSNRRWINRLMAMTLDFLGGSSYVWARKHNIIHHTYSNITGYDDDINVGVFGRFTPHQQRRRMHRFQHYYLWFLYGMLPIKWQIFDDFRDVIAGRVGSHRLPRPRGWDLVILLGGKVVFFTFALAIPLCVHSFVAVLLFYLLVSFCEGVALSMVFQLAHCVEEAAFPVPAPGNCRMEAPWAIHQVETTVDYGRNNRLLCWFVGGLNFQIEHHLFPQICHLHYPALAKVVEETCREHGVRYVVQNTFRASVASHFRLLRRMGREGSGIRGQGTEVVG